MGGSMDRYLAGEHEAVWSELAALGEGIGAEPLATEAAAVARETMTRVRKNIERLENSLRSRGYEFWEELCPAFSPPPPDQAKVVLEELREGRVSF